MIKRGSNNTLAWVLLVLIGTSVTLTTLHSHHRLTWHIDQHQADTGNTLTRNSNFCPVSGYLFNAKVVSNIPQISAVVVSAFVVLLSETQQVDPFYGEYTGRSPPHIG